MPPSVGAQVVYTRITLFYVIFRLLSSGESEVHGAYVVLNQFVAKWLVGSHDDFFHSSNRSTILGWWSRKGCNLLNKP